MVLASGILRCSPVPSFALLSARVSAFLLLTRLSWAVFYTPVAAQQSVGELDAIGVNTDHEGIPVRFRINVLSGSSIEAGLQITIILLVVAVTLPLPLSLPTSDYYADPLK